MENRYLVFDFGGTFAKYAWMDPQGNIIRKDKKAAPLSDKNDFKNFVRERIDEDKEICGIAISMPGILDPETGHAYRAGSYKCLAGENIYDLLKEITDLPVSVENDGKAAALAEQWKGSLKDVNCGAAVIIGTGLGGGIIMNHELQRGSHFAAGEITAILMEPGNYSMDGSAALKTGMTGFLLDVAKTKNMNPADFEISANFLDGETERKNKISGKDVFKWIEEGDPETLEAYRRWLEALTFVLINLKVILDPEKIVIGGGVSGNERFLHDLKKEYSKAGESMSVYKRFNCQIERCAFKEDANLLGALAVWKKLYSDN